MLSRYVGLLTNVIEGGLFQRLEGEQVEREAEEAAVEGETDEESEWSRGSDWT